MFGVGIKIHRCISAKSTTDINVEMYTTLNIFLSFNSLHLLYETTILQRSRRQESCEEFSNKYPCLCYYIKCQKLIFFSSTDRETEIRETSISKSGLPDPKTSDPLNNSPSLLFYFSPFFLSEEGLVFICWWTHIF